MDCKFPLYNVKTLFQYREGRDGYALPRFSFSITVFAARTPGVGDLPSPAGLKHLREHSR